MTDDERARIHTPAEVTIGARTPQEIALSIMSEVVRAIRVDGLTPPTGSATGTSAAAPERAIDPVCGMTVLIGPDTPRTQVDGQDHWFCSTGCLASFAA